jgi:hypothetical protein
MTLHLAQPRFRRGQKLAFSFDEDDLTLAWDAVRRAALPAGAQVNVEGLALPTWFWQGTGLMPVADAAAPWTLRSVATTVGPAVALHQGGLPDVEAAARDGHGQAPQRDEAAWQRHRLAREAPDTEADFPLGAYVLPARHDEVTASRMRLPSGQVVAWTAIGAGAAPSEFVRLQDAVGAYHVALVEAGGRRTVGLWAGDAAPTVGQACAPVLRRLFRTQGAWRHGVKFAPPQP